MYQDPAKVTAQVNTISDAPRSAFEKLGLDARVLEVLASKGFKQPTFVQSEAIPKITEGHSLIALAQTGSGKTISFIAPLVQKIDLNARNPLQALVLVPSLVLATQINEEFAPFAQRLGIRTRVLAEKENCKGAVSMSAHILIATPDDLAPRARNSKENLSSIHTLIIDECDLMLSGEFGENLRDILHELPEAYERQTLLFSATLPRGHEALVAEVLPGGLVINADYEAPLASINHQSCIATREQQIPLLLNWIKQEKEGSFIVFRYDKLSSIYALTMGLRENNIKVQFITTDQPTAEKSKCLASFRAGKFKVLICPIDLARGLDVANVTHVINYDFPRTVEEYKQGAGRTGRAGKTGTAITIAPPWQKWDLKAIYANLQVNGSELEIPKDLVAQQIEIDPEDAKIATFIEQTEQFLEYKFQNPGLLFTLFNKTRVVNDPRESRDLLNFTGRHLSQLCLTVLLMDSVSLIDISEAKRLIERGGHPNQVDQLTSSAGFDRFVAPNIASTDPHQYRASNAQQAYFNCLAAMYLDSGDLKSCFALVRKVYLHDEQINFVLQKNLKLEPAVRITAGVEAKNAFEDLLGHKFAITTWLDLALQRLEKGENGLISTNRILSRIGSKAVDFLLSDLIRNAYFDDNPRGLRSTLEAMQNFEEGWNSPNGAKLSHLLQEHFNLSANLSNIEIRSVFSVLIGALYMDGGLEPARKFLYSCHPLTLEDVERAKERTSSSADLGLLQQSMDDEKERIVKRGKTFKLVPFVRDGRMPVVQKLAAKEVEKNTKLSPPPPTREIERVAPPANIEPLNLPDRSRVRNPVAYLISEAKRRNLGFVRVVVREESSVMGQREAYVAIFHKFIARGFGDTDLLAKEDAAWNALEAFAKNPALMVRPLPR